MKTKDLIEGLQILQKYRDNQNGYDVGAEHDAIYAFSTNRPVNKKDLKRLIELGWFQNSIQFDCEFTTEDYDPDIGWIANL